MLNCDYDYEKNVQGLPKTDVLSIPSIPGLRFEIFQDIVKNRDGKILEIGCGGGAFIYNVNKYCSNLQVYGIDISVNGVIEAKREIGKEVKWLVGDGLALPFQSKSFDVLILMDVVEHVNDINQLLKECARILINGGILHASIPIERNIFTIWWILWKIKIGSNLTRKYLGHIQRLSINEIIEEFKKAGFIINSKSYTRHLIGQCVSFLGFCLPKEILSQLFRPSILEDITDYSINKYHGKEKLSFCTKILLIIRNIWYIFLTIFSALSYYESKLLRKYKLFASDIHITCVINKRIN